MNVLVLGSGGREHALAWKISQSPRAEKVYLHPGNPGARREGFENFGNAKSVDEIAARARELNVALVMIGPEAYLAEGFADELRRRELVVVGPNKKAAQLETSKVFAKEFMSRAGIPTAPFWIVDNESDMLAKVDGGALPFVLKLDGLAAGKGVVIVKSLDDARAFAKRIWHDGEFGRGPHRVLGEGFIKGVELSYMGMCDGETFLPLTSATDFKRVGNDDSGPNTGGMGAVSPSPYFSAQLETKVRVRILDPILRQLRKDDLPYRGVLYAGLMIDAAGDPYVLEFNARFGDPETQAVLMRLDSDFVTLLESTARATLKSGPILHWQDNTAVYVVGAAEGYPEKVTTGDAISGVDDVANGAKIFYSGVAEKDGKLVVSGGRVLGVGAVADDAESARRTAYGELKRVKWRGMHYRSDIGLVKS